MSDVIADAGAEAKGGLPSVPAEPRTAPGLPALAPPLGEEQVRHVEVLLDHVVEAGLDPEGTTVTACLEALALYRRAVGRDEEAALGLAKDLIRLHGQLAALTAGSGISGRTISSSSDSQRHLCWIRLLGIACLAGAVAAELPAAGSLAAITDRLAAHAVPFCWGAIGAIVFLMKTITDRASDLTFDARRLQGLPERVLLGALCGTITVNLFGTEAELMTRAAMGFLAGLGTKAVYAGFETLVNGVADRIGGKQAGH